MFKLCNFLLLACLFLFTHAAAQNLNTYEKPTKAHQLIRGTNVSMIPPPGFVQSSNMKGFQNPEDPTSMIMLIEIPGPYAEIVGGFTPEKMLSKNMTMLEKQEIKLGGYDGLLLAIDQEANGMFFSKWLLVYGDASKTTMINTVYVKDSVALGEQMKACVQSTVIDQGVSANPRENLDFTLDETRGDLQFCAVMGNGMVFSRDGKLPTDHPDKVALITDKSFAKVEVGDQKQFCIDRLKKYPDPMRLPAYKDLKPVKIDGLEGYQLFTNNLNKPEESMMQVLLFPEEGGYYMMVGIYLENDKKSRKDLEAVVKTFKRKV